jgi:hypothetical protein
MKQGRIRRGAASMFRTFAAHIDSVVDECFDSFGLTRVVHQRDQTISHLDTIGMRVQQGEEGFGKVCIACQKIGQLRVGIDAWAQLNTNAHFAFALE